MSGIYRPDPVPAPLALILATLPGEESEQLEATFHFASSAHRRQLRDEGTPFIDHPVRVAQILWEELGQTDLGVLQAALTHDVLEDCPWIDPDALATLIGERPFQIVVELTKPTAAAGQRTARDRAYLDRLPKLPLDTRLVKLADRIDNLRSITAAGRPDKARRYLVASRAEFIPLALATNQTAARLIAAACDEVERYLDIDDPTEIGFG